MNIASFIVVLCTLLATSNASMRNELRAKLQDRVRNKDKGTEIVGQEEGWSFSSKAAPKCSDGDVETGFRCEKTSCNPHFWCNGFLSFLTCPGGSKEIRSCREANGETYNTAGKCRDDCKA